MKRKRIPKAIESDVLLKSARRCAMCYGLYGDFEVKRGQIAHINHDSSNNEINNLAFLCLEHHDLYDSGMSQSKGILESEIKLYRDVLYKDVENQLPRFDKQLPSLNQDRNDHFHIFIESLRESQSIRSTILNDYEIEKSVYSGFIGIDSFDRSQLSLASYKLSLGEKASIKGKIVDINPNTPLMLRRKAFAHILTREFVSLPNGLIGHIYPIAGLSTRGVSVYSGGRIDSGWRGRLFVRVENKADEDIKVAFGSAILSIEFMLLNTVPRKYYEERYSARFDILEKITTRWT